MTAARPDPAGRDEVLALAEWLPITRQAVAKHLAVLSQAGLVTSSKYGREVRFAVRTTGLSEAAAWLAQLAAELDTRLTTASIQNSRT